MRSLPWLVTLLLLLLLPACGGDKKPAASGPEAPPAPAVDPAEAARKAAEAAQAREERLALLRTRHEELTAKLARLEKNYAEMVAAHAKEEAGLPNPADLRPRLSRLIKDANNEKARLEQMEQQYEEVKRVAEGSLTGELKALREKQKAAEAAYIEAQSGWRKVLLEETSGAVQETPVQRELSTLRDAKEKWFELTPESRRGNASGAVAKSINESFRRWLEEASFRGETVNRILEIPEAPKGKTVDTYDFTDLGFYVLLEIRENTLDRQNIVAENERLKEEETKLREIEAAMDAATELVAAKMSEGGGDLAAYEDLHTRLPGQRAKANDLASAVGSMRENFQRIEELKQGHLAAQDVALKEMEAAKKELQAAAAELRAAGG